MTQTYQNATLAKYLVGCVVYFPLSSPPEGYLKANGAAISRSTYSDLFAVIGITFGSGDGSTTFNLPDLRGEFVRCWDDGRGIDSSRTINSAQSDAIRNITGSFGPVDDMSAAVRTGALYYAYAYSYDATSSGSGGGWVLGFDASRVVPTSTENRPRNISLLACIKY